MDLSTFLQSAFVACSYTTTKSLYGTGKDKRLEQEIYQACASNLLVNTLRFHYITPFGYNQLMVWSKNTAPEVTVPPDTVKVLPKAVASTVKANQIKVNTSFVDLHTRTTNLKLNDIPGEILLNLQLFFADQPNTELFLNLDWVDPKTKLDSNKNISKDVLNIFIIDSAFNKDIIEQHKLYHSKQLESFLNLATSYYLNKVKIIFINKSEDVIPTALSKYIAKLDSNVINVTNHIERNVGVMFLSTLPKKCVGEVQLLIDTDGNNVTAKLSKLSEQCLVYEDMHLALRKLKDLHSYYLPILVEELNIVKYTEEEVATLLENLLDKMIEETVVDTIELYKDKGLSFFTDTRENLVGADNLIKYVRQIKTIKDNPVEAAQLNLKLPSGILLLGPPGTGKTLSVEKMRDILGVAAVQFDPETYLRSALGETDVAVREALRLASKTAGILFIDEIEKFLSTKDTNVHPVTQRIVAIFLKWMESSESKDIIVVATANKPDLLSPELLRRFNMKFLFDLPDSQSRRELISNKLTSHFVTTVSENDMDMLVEYSEGLSGSDISNIISTLVMEEFGNSLTSNICSKVLTSRLREVALSVSNSKYKEYYSSDDFLNWCNLHYAQRAQSYQLSMSF
jgi:ATP-dependent 26S proteasome regulatory subunit